MQNKSGSSWRDEENKAIRTRREKAFGVDGPAEDEQPQDLVGLSLSGGGIRSAMFNDGFLQGISHRGLLRYVDYLSSVSGGGYIAGHLTASAAEVKEQTDGATDNADYELPERGRDPKSGRMNPDHLAGIGGYLSHPWRLLPGYAISLLLSLAFYVGVLGIVATVLALFWRTFDDPLFREVYFGILGLRVGNELAIALIPAGLTIAVVGVLIPVVWWPLRRLAQFLVDRTAFVEDQSGATSRQRLRRLPGRVAALRLSGRYWTLALICVLVALLVSAAIFLGNEKTNAHANSTDPLLLNHYAELLALVAGGIQILVFLGRGQLFKSEQQEAKASRKHLSRLVTLASPALVFFAFVHWMGRENISGYTQSRDPLIERGDVTNWHQLNAFFSKLEGNGLGESLPARDQVPEWLAPPLRRHETVVSRSLALHSHEADSMSPEVLNAWLLPTRFKAAMYAYVESLWGDAYIGTPTERQPELRARLDQELRNDSPVGETIATVCELIRGTHLEQDELVRHWNARLAERQLSVRLVDVLISKSRPKRQTTAPTSPQGKPSVVEPQADSLIKALEPHAHSLSASQRRLVATGLNVLVAEGRGSVVEDGQTVLARRTRIRFNRLLLEMLFPDAIQQMHVASTWVVPPHDQLARMDWLLCWLLLAFVGSVGSLFRFESAAFFRFYQDQIGRHFLKGAADKELGELRPWEAGYPYPLILASAMQPVTMNDSYAVKSTPYLFTPGRCGSFGAGESAGVASSAISVGRPGRASAVTLQEAVTLSGAAVSRLMTANRFLSMFLDLFHTGLGQRLYSTEKVPGVTLDRWERFAAGCVLASVVTFLLAPADYAATGVLGIGCGTAGLIAFLAALRARRRVRNRQCPRRSLGWYKWAGVGALFLLFAAYKRTQVGTVQTPQHLQFTALLVSGALVWLWSISFRLRLGPPAFLWRLWNPKPASPAEDLDPESGFGPYIADGGFYDYLGLTPLLHRRCNLMIVSDAGAHLGGDSLSTLARAIEQARSEFGIRFLDLDHDGPIDFGRLSYDESAGDRLVHQPYLCLRVRYPDRDEDALLFYCQMAISERDPIEIREVRNRFPSFPDEPTSNQFYTDEQVMAYRTLGYHIASRLCHELEPWRHATQSSDDLGVGSKARHFGIDTFERTVRCIRTDKQQGCRHQPLFQVLRNRLLVGYRLACHEEVGHNEQDIYSEAIWPSLPYAFPTLKTSCRQLWTDAADDHHAVAMSWLREYECNADVRAAYRTAALCEINATSVGNAQFVHALWDIALTDRTSRGHDAAPRTEPNAIGILTAHLSAVAVACHEVHRGRPHATFQIDGRRKLINLCHSIAEAFLDERQQQPNTRDSLASAMDSIIADVTEVQHCVFQGCKQQTAVSFALIVAVTWGKETRRLSQVTREDVEAIHTRLGMQGLRTRRSGRQRPMLEEARMVEMRRRLATAFDKVHLDQAINVLSYAWTLGFLDAAEIRNIRTSPPQHAPRPQPRSSVERHADEFDEALARLTPGTKSPDEWYAALMRMKEILLDMSFDGRRPRPSQARELVQRLHQAVKETHASGGAQWSAIFLDCVTDLMPLAFDECVELLFTLRESGDPLVQPAASAILNRFQDELGRAL